MGKVNSIEDFFKSNLPESEKRRLDLEKKIAETEEEKRMIKESLKRNGQPFNRVTKDSIKPRRIDIQNSIYSSWGSNDGEL